MLSSMRKTFLPSHFVALGMLVLILVSLYGFIEARRLKREFLRQTEDKGVALASAMAAGVTNAIVGNVPLENQIEQRLFENARLIDQLLLTRRVDQALLMEVSARNRLQKIDLLDPQGQPREISSLSAMIARKEQVVELPQQREPTLIYMWGKRLRSQEAKPANPVINLPTRITANDFWKGSAIGVAVVARSFPGIIAVHANADYILNFEKEIGLQNRIQELGSAAEAEFVALLDSNFNVVAHTDMSRIGQREKDTLVLTTNGDRQLLSQIVESSGGKEYLEVVKPVALYQSNMGFLKVGISLGSMEIAWRNSLRAILILGIAIFAVGMLGMAAIFHNQNSHLRHVKGLEIEVLHRERLSAMGDVAAAVAHEVRNPLNAISMGLQRLKMEFKPSDDQEDYSRLTGLMLSEVHRLNSIVEQFLALAHPIEIKPEPLPLPEVLKELAALQDSTARDSNVCIQVIAAPNMPPLMADPAHFTQVLLNLMLNGLQAMPHGGTLTLEAKALNGKCLIAVADTGAGIAPENQQRIFEPYFTTKVKGTGLGLAISRRIIEAHGGTLTVTSKVGQGSRFEISLPLNRAEV